MFTSWLLKPAVLMTLTVIAPVTDEPRVLWVDVGACPGMGSGTDADPFCKIQDAYDNAAHGDEIRVLPGLYEECVDAFDPAILKTVHLIADAHDPSDLASAALTTIDGSHVPLCGRLSSEDPSHAERAVVELGGMGSSLTGFLVRGGGRTGVYASGSVVISHNTIEGNYGLVGDGAGITVRTDNCKLGDTMTIVSNNVVRENEGYSGGGILASAGRHRFEDPDVCPGEGDAVLTISDNRITGNVTISNGAGLDIRTFTSPGRSAEVVITRNVVTGNRAGLDSDYAASGGGMWVTASGGGEETITVSRNRVEDNYAKSSGGGISATAASIRGTADVRQRVEVASNVLRGNRTAWGGGGLEIVLWGEDLDGPEQLVLIAKDNLIEQNSCTLDADFNFSTRGGGGVSARIEAERTPSAALSMQVLNNVIRNNSAVRFGGGLVAEVNARSSVDFNGQLMREAAATLDVVGNLIEGNSAEFASGDASGGGVFALLTAWSYAAADVNLSLNTIVGNTLDNEVQGGGIHVEAGFVFGPPRPNDGTARALLNSNIVEGNRAVGIGGPEPYRPGLETLGPVNLVVEVTHSDVVNNSGGNYAAWLGDRTGVDGNISIDPGFVDPAAGDFHVTGDSPVVDAGDPATPPAAPPSDSDGDPRVVDGTLDGVATVDIGYDEWVLEVISVGIDVKPVGFPNSVNPRARGLIPVAVLGSAEFDVTSVDGCALRFGPDEAEPAHRPSGSNDCPGHFEDVDLDGYIDLVTHYRTRETGIECGHETATLTGTTLWGEAFAGSDSIRTVGCPMLSPGRYWLDGDRGETPAEDGRLVDPARSRQGAAR